MARSKEGWSYQYQSLHGSKVLNGLLREDPSSLHPENLTALETPAAFAPQDPLRDFSGQCWGLRKPAANTGAADNLQSSLLKGPHPHGITPANTAVDRLGLNPAQPPGLSSPSF